MNENDMIEAPAQDGVIEMAGLLSLLTNGPWLENPWASRKAAT